MGLFVHFLVILLSLSDSRRQIKAAGQIDHAFSLLDRARFDRSVARTLQAVQDVLDDTRKFKIAGDVPHTYDDKFLWVELLTSATWKRLYEVILLDQEQLGAWSDSHKRMERNVPHRSIVFRWERRTKCEFVEQAQVDVPIETQTGTVKSSLLGTLTGTYETIHKFQQYRWNVTEHYSWTAEWYDEQDNSNNDKVIIPIFQRTMSTPVLTRAQDPPVMSSAPPPRLLNVTTWWQRLTREAGDVDPLFEVNRTDLSCKTPRRNHEVERALLFHSQFHEWMRHVVDSMATLYDNAGGLEVPVTISSSSSSSSPPDQNESPDAGSAAAAAAIPSHIKLWNDLLHMWLYNEQPEFVGDFPALLPMMQQDARVFDPSILWKIMDQQDKAMRRILQSFVHVFPEAQSSSMISFQEAKLVILLQHCMRLLIQHSDALNYVEELLYKQLVQAVGQELTSDDFDQYMKYHHSRFLAPAFRPRPLALAVQRPEQDPVGFVSIEGGTDSHSPGEPIRVMSKTFTGLPSISIPLNAATSVSVSGNRTLSGGMRYRFAEEDPIEPILVARSRQFSSFLLVVGSMTGPNTLEPHNAIIVQNKDEVLIPLLAQVLPSAKEFKDAITSLSPEQQEFARAFRHMQLTSSVFAFCLIDLKPQFELLLNLPEDSLSKEIKLTQDLMTLFIEYQIPSNLLSYDGALGSSPGDKVKVVKEYVQAVLDVIQATKQEELKEEKMRFEARHAERDFVQIPPLMAAQLSSVDLSASLPWHGRVLKTSGAIRGSNKLRDIDTMVQEAEESDASPVSYHSTTSESRESSQMVDFTLVPGVLDKLLEKHDADGHLRSTILKAKKDGWVRHRQRHLLAPSEEAGLDMSEIGRERKKALDLLDAITRSGTLPLAFAEVHCLILVTHCFTKALIDTLVQDNVNPILKVEKSTLLLASTVFDVPMVNLMLDNDYRNQIVNESAGLINKTMESVDEVVKNKG